MRTYKVLQETARRFNADAEIQAALAELRERGQGETSAPTEYTRQAADALKAASFDVEGIAAQGLGYERLDQLTTELLLGAR